MKEKNTEYLLLDKETKSRKLAQGWVTQLIDLERKLNELKVVSGMSVDELIEKFKAGYTLKEPDPALQLANELRELTEGIWDTLKQKEQTR